MIDGPWHICVLVPARNEEKLLSRCLQSIRRARARVSLPMTTDIVVIDDGSTDSTFSIAKKSLAGSGVVLRTNAGIVGAVRRAGAAIALSRYSGPSHRCWLANTDADCIVPATWLIDQLRLASEGVEAIAGTVSVDSFAEHDGTVEGRFRLSYTIHEDGSHPHVHGANLGVRADAYLRAGEWNALETAEDHDLWGRLRNMSAARLSTAGIEVITSGRRQGRAPSGFAGALAAHNQTAA